MEYIGIANSVTMYPAAPYEARIEVMIVDLCACHRQDLVAMVGTVR